MTDNEALDILNDALSWDNFGNEILGEELKNAVLLAVQALAEKVAREA